MRKEDFVNRIAVLCGMVLVGGCVATPTVPSRTSTSVQIGGERPLRDGPAESDKPPESHGPPVNLEDGLTLEEALRLAMAQNPGLEAVRREMELARAQRLTAGQRPYNPELFGGVDRAFPLTGTEDSVVGGGISQVFEIGGQRGYRISVAEANIERTQATVSDAERLVRADVATAFFENLMLDERTRLAIENVEIAENLLEAAQARFEAKQIPEVDLNLVRLQHQRTKNESALVAARRRAARLRLAALLGEAGRTEFTLEGDLQNTAQEITRETALQTAWEYRADLNALRHQARMAQAQIGLEKSQVWPTVELGAIYSYETLSIDSLRSTHLARCG